MFYNKKHAYTMGNQDVVPVPKTSYPKSENDLKEIFDIVGFLCLIKMAIGYDFLRIFKS